MARYRASMLADVAMLAPHQRSVLDPQQQHRVRKASAKRKRAALGEGAPRERKVGHRG